jgi:hypothetical protein
VEEEEVEIVETKSSKVRPGGTEGRGGRCTQRGRLKTFSHRDSSRELLEKEHKIQRIPWYSERDGDNGSENQRRDSKQSIDRDGQRIAKMVQSI